MDTWRIALDRRGAQKPQHCYTIVPHGSKTKTMFQSQILRSCVVVCMLYFATGCASLHTREPAQPGPDEIGLNERDPWKGFNRAVYKFNDRFDDWFMEPAARGYRRVMPTPLRLGVGNFFRNLFEPTTVVNALLQGKVRQALSDTGRFLINSTVGVLGLFDVASKVGVERHEEDFGQTLAVWGVGSGPYLVLPFLGPSSVRDAFGLLPYWYYTDPRLAVDSLGTRATLIGLDFLDYRAQLLGATKVLDMQLDPYVFARESYRQKRIDQIFDGDPPLEPPPF